jgi:hypothetical protein
MLAAVGGLKRFLAVKAGNNHLVETKLMELSVCKGVSYCGTKCQKEYANLLLEERF